MMHCHLVAIVLSGLWSAGCVRTLAIASLSDALSKTGGIMGEDDDPDLVEAAIPFALKTMEGLLQEQPDHRGLLTALASGFVQYGVAFVNQAADRASLEGFERTTFLRARAKRMFLRARAYGFRSLEATRPGFGERLKTNPSAALFECDKDDVERLFWTTAAWGLLISSDKTDVALIADLATVAAMADRLVELDSDWNEGAIWDLQMRLLASRPGGKIEEARLLFQRSVAASGGRLLSPYVTFAEIYSVRAQNLAEFHALLDKALAIDVDAYKPRRLANMLMRRRAEWLKTHAANWFLESDSDATNP